MSILPPFSPAIFAPVEDGENPTHTLPHHGDGVKQANKDEHHT